MMHRSDPPGLARPLQAILWDFGDTLADERWMLAPLDGVPEWPHTYRAILDRHGLADRWNLGLTTTTEVAGQFGAALGVPESRILAHMRACSHNIAYFPSVMELVAKLDTPQAIVTINPDIFSEIVVPACGLASRFAAIVTSWEEHSLSKADLCDIAMARIAGAVDRGACLLIDNKLENVDEWVRRGGLAWHFVGEADLVRRMSALFREHPSD